MGNALVAEGHFRLLTEIVEKNGVSGHWRVGRSGLGDRRGLADDVLLPPST